MFAAESTSLKGQRKVLHIQKNTMKEKKLYCMRREKKRIENLHQLQVRKLLYVSCSLTIMKAQCHFSRSGVIFIYATQMSMAKDEIWVVYSCSLAFLKLCQLSDFSAKILKNIKMKHFLINTRIVRFSQSGPCFYVLN